MSQDVVFVETEADRWFERNRAALAALDLQKDPVLRLVELYGVRPRRVLEVGGSNGYRVAELAKRTGAEGTVVEPSAAAIADGRARFPGVTFLQADAKALPTDGPFDLVIVNYVLHWVDRGSLLRTVAELDRVLADGGHLVIGDFAPSTPTRVRYHHRDDVELYTYKQDYAAIFRSTCLYHLVGSLSGDGHTLAADVTDDRRSATTLLQKRSTTQYVTREFKP